jgi:hypothetical protein
VQTRTFIRLLFYIRYLQEKQSGFWEEKWGNTCQIRVSAAAAGGDIAVKEGNHKKDGRLAELQPLVIFIIVSMLFAAVVVS